MWAPGCCEEDPSVLQLVLQNAFKVMGAVFGDGFCGDFPLVKKYFVVVVTRLFVEKACAVLENGFGPSKPGLRQRNT